MKKFEITNTTTTLISIAYNGSNGVLKFVDIYPYSLMQEVFIKEDEEEAFIKSFEMYEGKLHFGKMKAEKAQQINEDEEEKRLEVVTEVYDSEVEQIEETFNAHSDGEESSLSTTMTPKASNTKKSTKK